MRLLQLFHAAQKRLPVVCVVVMGGGYEFAKAKPLLNHLRTELKADEVVTLRAQLAMDGAGVGQLARALGHAIPNAISVFFDPAGKESAQASRVRAFAGEWRRAIGAHVLCMRRRVRTTGPRSCPPAVKCVPRVAQDAAVLDVIDKLGRSAAIVSTLDLEEGSMDERSLVPAKKLTKMSVAVRTTKMSVAVSKRPTPQTTSAPAAQAAPAGAPSIDV